MDGLACVDTLMDRSEALCARLAARHFKNAGFELAGDSGSERLVAGPGNKWYASAYRLREWRTAAGARLIWFSVKSEIPHMSSIVAAFAFPEPGSDIPMFVMNLNLKFRFSAYGVIAGFRCDPAFHPLLLPHIPELKARRRLDVPPTPLPPGFVGIRARFKMGKAPIVRSLEAAGSMSETWCARPALPSGCGNYGDMESYRGEMLALHAREKGVFDAVFGEGQLGKIFRETVFK